MLKNLTPDALDDIGDLLEAILKVCNQFHHDREVDIQDVCYCLIYLGIDCGLENFKKQMDVKSLIKEVWKKVLEIKNQKIK